jgi:eukaryotic-like serine/threonine-protein kinase
MSLSAGTKLGGYEVLALIGAGGMGEVYRARDSVLKRDVAIKVLPSFISHDPHRLRRFEQEAQAAAALNHPNILAVHQLGTFEGTLYLVSELLEGGTLREQLVRGPLPVRKAIDLQRSDRARISGRA